MESKLKEIKLLRLIIFTQDYKNISKQIREFYFNGGHVNADSLDNMNELMTDGKFIYSSVLNTRIQAAKSTGKTFYSM